MCGTDFVAAAVGRSTDSPDYERLQDERDPEVPIRRAGRSRARARAGAVVQRTTVKDAWEHATTWEQAGEAFRASSADAWFPAWVTVSCYVAVRLGVLLFPAVVVFLAAATLDAALLVTPVVAWAIVVREAMYVALVALATYRNPAFLLVKLGSVKDDKKLFYLTREAFLVPCALTGDVAIRVVLSVLSWLSVSSMIAVVLMAVECVDDMDQCVDDVVPAVVEVPMGFMGLWALAGMAWTCWRLAFDGPVAASASASGHEATKRAALDAFSSAPVVLGIAAAGLCWCAVVVGTLGLFVAVFICMLRRGNYDGNYVFTPNP